MKQLAQLGPDAYTKPSGPLNYIKALVESQANDGADYIAVNVDAFGEDDQQTAVDMMREYVKLVRRWSNGVPICIDSGNNDVLIAGLKEWYNTKEAVKQPLINSVKIYTMDKFFPLKRDYDYAFIGLIDDGRQADGAGRVAFDGRIVFACEEDLREGGGAVWFQAGGDFAGFDGFPAGDRYADGAGGAGIYLPGIRGNQEDKERPGDEGRALFVRHQQFGSRFAGAEDWRLQGLCGKGDGIRP